MSEQNDKALHLPCAFSRRDFLFRAGSGFGGLALSAMLAEEAASAQNQTKTHSLQVSPTTPKLPHFRPRAKSVIFLFMVGGPSHIETSYANKT